MAFNGFLAGINGCLLVLACGAACSAQDTAANSVVMHQPVLLEIFLSRSLIDGALQAQPTALWSDPQARLAVAEIELQVRRHLADVGEQAWAELVAHGSFVHYCAVASDAEGQTQAIRIDAGEAGLRSYALLKQMVFGLAADGTVPSQVIHGIAGCLSGRQFLGISGNSIYLGHTDEIGNLTAHAPSDLPPCRIHVDYGPGLKLLEENAKSSANPYQLPPVMARCLPGLGTLHPQAELTCTAGPTGWSSATDLTGTGHLPLHAINDRIGRAASAHSQILLACGLDPTLTTALAALAHAVPGWTSLLSVVSAQGTGDLLLQGGWSSGFIPDVSLSVLVKDPAEAMRALATACAAASGTAAALASGVPGWHVSYPLGFLSATIVGERLVIATSDELALTVARNDNPQVLWPEGDTLALRLDLPELGKRWLPFAYALAQGKVELLGDDPFMAMYYLAWTMQQKGLSLHDLAPADVRNICQDLHLKQIFPQGVAAGMDAALAVYRLDLKLALLRDPARPPQRLLLLHLEDGYQIFTPNAEDRILCSPAEVRRRLLPYRLESGPALDAMPLVHAPAVATVSSKWLPPLAVALGHLVPYRCDVRLRKDSLLLQEQGLPLLPALLLFSGLVQNEFIFTDRDMKHQRMLMIDRLNARTLAAPAAQQKPPAPAGF